MITLGNHVRAVYTSGLNVLHRLIIAIVGGGYAYLLLQTYEQLSKTWSYLGFWYVNQDPSVAITSVVASASLGFLLPIKNWTIVGFAKWVLYFLLFIPSLVIPPQQGALQNDMLLLLESLIWFSSAAVILFLRNGAPFPAITLTKRLLLQGVFVCWLLGNMAIYAAYGGSMSLVGIEDVYQQRSAANQVGGNVIVYVLGFMSGAINPFMLAVGLTQKKPVLIALALAGQIIVYSTLAGKVVLGSTLLVIAVLFAFRQGKVIFARIYAAVMIIGIMGPIVSRPRFMSGDLISTVSDLIYMRILVLPGVLVGCYSDFFSRYPLTYLSHSIVGKYFVEYPYGGESVGQVIGRYVTPTASFSVNNYNANFIAADAVAGFGPWGIPPMLAFFAFTLWLISKLAGREHTPIACAVLVPFIVSLADSSIFTAILTGGGGAAAVLLYLFRSAEFTEANKSSVRSDGGYGRRAPVDGAI